MLHRKVFLLILNLFLLNIIGANAQSKMRDYLGEDSIRTIVDQKAAYPYGRTGMTNYIIDKIDWNTLARNKVPPGTYTIIVKFVIDKTGVANNVEAETNYGYGLEEEAKRIIRKMPKWWPATLAGVPVHTIVRQPVTFSISS
jgi:protein TonB